MNPLSSMHQSKTMRSSSVVGTMGLVSSFMARLDPSLELCHVTIEDWIVFQRSRFDHIDSNGEPYICQVFLIQIHTGQYVHRVQGQRVDHGLATDSKALEAKLIHAFRSIKPCQGIPIKEIEPHHPMTQILNLPYPRRVSKNCLHYIDTNLVQPKGYGLACSSCQRVCHDLECDVASPWPEDQAIKVEDLYLEEVGDVESDGGSSMGLSFSYQSDEELPPQKVAKLNGKGKPSPEDSDVSLNGLNDEERQKEIRKNRARMQRRRRLERLEAISCRVCQKKCKDFSKLLIHTAKSHPEETCLQALAQSVEEIRGMKDPKMCRTCHRFCNGGILLNQHKEVYHELGDFNCVDCQEASLTFHDLILHNYQKHGKAIEHKTLHTHGLAAIHHEDGKIEYKRERFACHLCEVSFATDTGLTFHLRSNHFWGLFECKVCDLKCHYAPDISAHVQNFHAECPEIDCVYCEEKIAHNMLNEHLDQCKKVYNGKTKKKHAVEYQCNYCGKKYTSGGRFKAHILQHEGTERYKCSFCDFGNNIRSIVLDHEKSHLGQKGLTEADTDVVLFHQCDQCGKQFSHKKSLDRHIQRVHEGVRPKYRCSDCKFFAYSNSILYKHKREAHGFITRPMKSSRFACVKVQK